MITIREPAIVQQQSCISSRLLVPGVTRLLYEASNMLTFNGKKTFTAQERDFYRVN